MVKKKNCAGGAARRERVSALALAGGMGGVKNSMNVAQRRGCHVVCAPHSLTTHHALPGAAASGPLLGSAGKPTQRWQPGKRQALAYQPVLASAKSLVVPQYQRILTGVGASTTHRYRAKHQ